MCGIAGVVRTLGGAGLEPGIRCMTHALRHRGPDDEGYALFAVDGVSVLFGGAATPPSVYSGVFPYAPVRAFREPPYGLFSLAFGHRRLAILDASAAGHQPMCTPDRRYWMVYNGEVYNYIELRERLATQGDDFLTQTDTEVLLRLVARHGVGALEDVEGMFAFALYDAREQTLLLARDAFGIKPLYWSAGPGWFAFASEPQALLCLDEVGGEIDAVQVARYLAVQPTEGDERTFFADIRRLPAGTCLRVVVGTGAVRGPRQWYQLSGENGGGGGIDDAAARLGEMFSQSVSRHMRSDVPVGAALSGGVDSSSVLVTMQRVAGSSSLAAVSFDALDPALSEARYAAMAAHAAGGDLHMVRADGLQLAQDMDALILAHGEPVASASVYAQYRVMQAASLAGIRVMLDGQGADELFAGYRPYIAARIMTLARAGRLGAAARLWRSAVNLPDVSSRMLLERVGKLALPAVAEDAWRRLSGRRYFPAWANAAWFAEKGVAARPMEKLEGPQYLRSECHFALTRGFLGELLRYEDRNSMAFSIESRLPFLTPQMAAFAQSLPESYLIGDDGRGKRVLLRAMRGTVPNAILDRRDKIGFAAPDGQWLREAHDWLDDALSTVEVSVLDMQALRAGLRHHARGGAYLPLLWRGVSLALWAKAFDVSFDGGGA